jgi:hypothetical protein
MEERTRHKIRELTIEDSFECSRLEKRLLAQAYEHVVPSLVREVGGPVVEDQHSRGFPDRFPLTETGGASWTAS